MDFVELNRKVGRYIGVEVDHVEFASGNGFWIENESKYGSEDSAVLEREVDSLELTAH